MPTEPVVSLDVGSLETPIWWPLRAWMVVEIVFGLLAILTIFLDPGNTATNFAWPIKPDVMAATLGAFYAASAIIFILPLFGRTWQQVRAMIIPTAIFATAMLLATFLHWDKFSVGTRPFTVWFASYLLPPPIFAALYWWHQRRSAPVGVGIAAPLPGWASAFLRANGAIVASLAIMSFAAPALLQRTGPWSFTPLTVRTLCGWLLGVGLMQVWMSWEGDWQRIKLATSMLIVLPFTLLLQLLRFSGEVQWGNAALLALLADVLAVAAVLLALWGAALAGSRRDSPAIS
jgi:hypothetical protein